MRQKSKYFRFPLLIIILGMICILSSAGVKALELDNGLVLHYHFNNQASFGENSLFINDFSSRSNDALTLSNGARWNSLGGLVRDGAFDFDGYNDYIEVSDSNSLSPSTTNKYTIAFWVKFNRTKFIGEGNNKDYINILGKGDDGEHEFVFRYYNSSNIEGRNNRISFYMFNPQGGLGAGSYVQENIQPGEWMFLVGIYNGTHVQLWKNGVLKDTDPLSGYDIVSRNGDAPLTIGTVGSNKYFRGSFDELRIYNRVLTRSEILSLYNLRNFN